jgi:hypothetical protein
MTASIDADLGAAMKVDYGIRQRHKSRIIDRPERELPLQQSIRGKRFISRTQSIAPPDPSRANRPPLSMVIEWTAR